MAVTTNYRIQIIFFVTAEKCYAFIEYESPGDAHDAISQLNKTRLLGLELKVELTKYKRSSNNGLCHVIISEVFKLLSD